MSFLIFTQERKYQGAVDDAPRWVRSSVVSWYRRVCVNGVVMYSVVFTGIMFFIEVKEWYRWLSFPTLVLLYEITHSANRLWYLNRYDEVEKKQYGSQ